MLAYVSGKAVFCCLSLGARESSLRAVVLRHGPAGFSEPRVLHFPASQLPSAPAARFAALFAVQPRWTREQLDPYLAGLRVSCEGGRAERVDVVGSTAGRSGAC